MGNSVLKTLLNRKISIFLESFGDDSNDLFKNEQGSLIHPGEYGSYRERCLKELLRFILRKEFSVSDGFMINSNDQVSTQCDIIIYESNVFPLVDNGIANFFPIEIVKSFGEVKSSIDKSKLTSALKKLAENKMLFEKKGTMAEYNNFVLPFSFLVCKSLKEVDIPKLDFKKVYNGIERKYWHNIILSIDNGVVTYVLNSDDFPEQTLDIVHRLPGDINKDGAHHPFPYFINIVNNFSNEWLETRYGGLLGKDGYSHVQSFLVSMAKYIPKIESRNFDIAYYLDLIASDSIESDS